jgi:hypothetical protein
MPMTEDELYALPLEEFTPARNALAKELKRGGDAAAADEVKGLTKPTKTAWALNQLARQEPEQIDRLLDAGAGLREAQEKALAGDASGLRPARQAEEEVVDSLVAGALKFLGGSGPAQAASADRLGKTLRAAATDPDAGALLRRGRLVADLDASGFGLDGLSEAPASSTGVPTNTDELQSRREARAARKEAEELRRKADTALGRAQRLGEEADRAEQRATDARAQADEAREAATQAQERADVADARADALGARDSGP